MDARLVWLYTVVPKGFFPQQDTGQMMGTTEAAQDISFEAMKEKQEQVVKTVLADPAVQAVGSFFGGGSGSALNSGRMFISLKPKGSGRRKRKDDVGAIIARLRQKLSKITGANLFLQPSQDIRVGGRSSKALYQYALTDQNIDELNTWAPKLVTKLHEYPQIKDATSDQQFRGLQENVVIDRDAAARLGIQPQAVDSTLYSAFGQRQVSIIYTQQNPVSRRARGRPEVPARSEVARQDLCQVEFRQSGAAEHHCAFRDCEHAALRQSPGAVSVRDRLL